MILIVGGTGTLGSALVRQLVDLDLPVTVMSRNPRDHADRIPAGIRLVQGDLRDPVSLRAAVDGQRYVISAAHSILGRGKNASRYVDDIGSKQLIDMAAAAGVERFVYVSAWFKQQNHLNAFFSAKQRVETYLQSTGLVHSTLRPTAFMETHAEQMIGERIAAKRPVIVFGSGAVPRNFVCADDVAKIIVEELRSTDGACRSIDVGGPQNLSSNNVIAIYETLLGRSAQVVRLPIAVATTMRWVFKPFHPGLSQIMDIAGRAERYGDGFLIEDVPQCANNTPLSSWVRGRMLEMLS